MSAHGFPLFQSLFSIARTNIADLEKIEAMELDPDNAPHIKINSIAEHEDMIKDTSVFHFKIIDDLQRMVGFMILARSHFEENSMELRRIVIADKGRGYGKSCIQWAKKFSFEKKGCNRLWLDVMQSNTRAVNLYSSLGFQMEGIKRACFLKNGSYHNLMLFSVIKTTETIEDLLLINHIESTDEQE